MRMQPDQSAVKRQAERFHMASQALSLYQGPEPLAGQRKKTTHSPYLLALATARKKEASM